MSPTLLIIIIKKGICAEQNSVYRINTGKKYSTRFAQITRVILTITSPCDFLECIFQFLFLLVVNPEQFHLFI